jgi:hypothetical protein
MACCVQNDPTLKKRRAEYSRLAKSVKTNREEPIAGNPCTFRSLCIHGSLKRQRRIVRDEAALGELRIPHKSNAKWRLEACTLGPSLALQASRESQVLSAQS